MKRIIYTNDEGGVSIIVPAPNCGLTIEEIAAKDVPRGKEYHIVDTETIPSDRTFRNAWNHSSGVIGVDMPKATEIQKNKLRAERAPLLSALDVKYMVALENGDTEGAASVAKEKQRLRDITKHPALVEAETPEDLKVITCDVG